MKLVNKTDKKTDALAQFGLVDRGIAVDGDIVGPGKSKECSEADKIRLEAEHAHLFNTGALAWEEDKPLPNALRELPSDMFQETPSTESKKKAR